MEIVSGVHQLRLPFPEGADRVTNAYVVKGSDGNILVDCGWDSPEAVWAFREALKVDVLQFSDIKWIVVTHAHPDHLGLAAKLRELCGAKVIMHRIDAASIQSRYVSSRPLGEAMEAMFLSHGVPADEARVMLEDAAQAAKYVTALEPDQLVEEGDAISNGTFRLQVVHTPGHTPGHICLYDSVKRRLFSGDHVLFNTVPRIGAVPGSDGDSAGDYVRSLKALVDRQVSFVFPGHGPVFNSLVIRSEELLRLCGAKQQRMLGILEEGLQTAYDVACRLPWKLDGTEVTYDELALRDKRAVVAETVAWMKHLALEGKVAPLERNGRVSYLAK